MEADQLSVDIAATGELALTNLRIANTSSIVDGYSVETPGAPEWLKVEAGQVQLLPGTKEYGAAPSSDRLRNVGSTQRDRLTVRVESLSQAPAHVDLSVLVVVPALDVPVRVHAEPRMLRVRDRDSAVCDLVVDNSASNRPAHLRFAGSDPELASDSLSIRWSWMSRQAQPERSGSPP